MGFCGGRGLFWMLESPLQNAMHDEVWIPPDGRSEMRVLVEPQRKMAERLSGVTRLLQRTQHEIGNDPFFRLADNFSNQALIVLRRDAQFAARERYFHSAFTAMAVRIGASGFCRRWNAAMSYGNLALVQMLDAHRGTEVAGHFFELQDFAGVRLFVNAMQRFDAALQEVRVDGAIGGQHEFFNEPLRNVAFAARDVRHALLFVELDHRFGKIEVDGAVFVAAGTFKTRHVLHLSQAGP